MAWTRGGCREDMEEDGGVGLISHEERNRK